VTFRDELLDVPPAKRDAWVDRAFALDELPDDRALPAGCVPYLPCPVDTIVRAVERAAVGPADVFVDIGSGLGRVTTLVHLLTGASAVGIEVQPHLVARSRALAERLDLPRVSVLEGDADRRVGDVTIGTVFFLYCPFSGARLERVLDEIGAIAATHLIRVCAVDLPLPARPWLEPVGQLTDGLAVLRSAPPRRQQPELPDRRPQTRHGRGISGP
jgi:SAM-dependent methyltransferase